ncbi:MAG: cysteine-rich KTR domain-containing protein [Gemmiger sp.]|uniref:cysteine-rich KTR domain-containing protein n=2 Tax=Gemmiger sp. TaxID=2049027 RepID=UPI002A808D45|nr:cysteine-rich KTR domain-containing protein [Gemmiger sp.]MDY4447978.1 cysteine-rich KTR domain-containing protein [Gemmiger sp.]MDY5410044.1 cysteine-rich KTR domain-containing protein [Gemmiger sp.]MDY5501643.1 cysteine-rich KTR domain-containing protein [Gemmiger sp.]
MAFMANWLLCPRCRKKTKVKILPETVLLHFPLYCPRCKKESIISVAKLKMILEKTES